MITTACPFHGPPVPNLPFTPEHIFNDGTGRWWWNGTDVTDRQVWWLCPEGHSYIRAIGDRINGAGCSDCEP